ncbi:hypothetical protein LEP1GSC166_1866 [Leptospira kirschneri]|nr:hypothetical protein LEP1GSC166_1866 [Leptospira kirschneri]
MHKKRNRRQVESLIAKNLDLLSVVWFVAVPDLKTFERNSGTV